MQKKLIILGTSSGVGKSILTTGICRVLYKDGYKVAPFKAQNMSRNSFTLENGLEISIAQVLQAQACNLNPKEYMNPLLLKPLGNNMIDIYLNGKHYCNMNGKEYTKNKGKFKNDVLEAFNKLNNFQICILEGAGSPVEINIKENDLVNMGMAEMIDSKAVLVADIDRGGVFASIVGTITLLEPEEKKRLKGIIINKFRGDKDILLPGIEKLEKITGVKVIGVIPYNEIDLEEEDSLNDKKDRKYIEKKLNGKTYEEYKEHQFNRLEELVRNNLDMNEIYKILGDE
ncbi:MAG: cobyric acid synthase [Fusobacterium sp. JB021]|nr:cobyric acid synthase [Fusobacterium sp. JB021]MDP0506712.1 cobyric acid synthase [Fusobacterium sp. JB019]